MKHTIWISAGCAGAMLLMAQQQSQTSPPPAAPAQQGGGFGGFGRGGPPFDYADNEGWVSLFDGQSLNGWDGDTRFWSARDGAIYVEPTGSYDDATYIANVTKIARVFVPSVFRRWRDLESFDVCQEPLPLFGRTAEPPPPKTQVLVTRQGVRRVRDWAHATLTQFLAASARANAKPNPDGSRQTLFVYVATELRSEPAYQRAADAAGVTTATTSAVR